MAKRGKIAAPSAKKGERVTAQEPEDTNKQTIAFSFERVQAGDYCFSVLDKDDMASVAKAMYRRKTMTWVDILSADRHGLGTEKMPKGDIKAPMPPFVTDDMDHFLVLRFNGMKPMVGYRKGRIFYILWFDHNFTLYDH